MRCLPRNQQTTKKMLPDIKFVTVFRTRKLAPCSVKDRVDSQSQSNIIYKFNCACGAGYIGKSARPLRFRMREHLPNWLYTANNRPRSTVPHNSSICRHLTTCSHKSEAFAEENRGFKILRRCHNSLELFITEGVCLKLEKPNITKQNDNLFICLLF